MHTFGRFSQHGDVGVCAFTGHVVVAAVGEVASFVNLVGQVAGRQVPFDSDNRFNACVTGLLIHGVCASHGAVVGNGDSGHSEVFRCLYEWAGYSGAVQHGEVRVDVQVYEIACFTHLE